MALIVMSRRQTHSRTSSAGRLQSRANASTLAGTTSSEVVDGRGIGSSYCPKVPRARCPTAEPSCSPVSIGPIVDIHRVTRSAGPTPGPGPPPPRSSSPRSISPRPAGGSSDPAASGEPSPVPGFDAWPGSSVVGASPWSGLASKRNLQSSTVRQAHAPGPTAITSTGAPVGVTDRPVSSLTCISATRASSSNWMRSEGSTLPSGCPFVAAPCANVRASSTRPPPGVAPPMSWRRSPRSCSSELPPPPGPGISTSGIVGGAGGDADTPGGTMAPRPDPGHGGRSVNRSG